MRVSKRDTPLKSGYLSVVGLSSMKMVADRHGCAAYHNKHWRRFLRNVKIDDLE